MTILFLDFDGVLHHENVTLKKCKSPSSVHWLKEHEKKYLTHTGYLVQGANLFEHCERLEAALAPFPFVRIVITSTWRIHFHFDDLKRFLSPGLASRVIGVTPAVFSRDGACQRSREIGSYLRVNKIENVVWIAIDDTDYLFCSGGDNSQVFLVDGSKGFTDANAVALTDLIAQTMEETGIDHYLEAAKREGQERSRELVQSGARTQESMFLISPEIVKTLKFRHRTDEL
jgi:hypothetical protein